MFHWLLSASESDRVKELVHGAIASAGPAAMEGAPTAKKRKVIAVKDDASKMVDLLFKNQSAVLDMICLLSIPRNL